MENAHKRREDCSSSRQRSPPLLLRTRTSPPVRAIFGQADLEAFHKSKVGLGGKGWR
jgi:hypothetical protein